MRITDPVITEMQQWHRITAPNGDFHFIDASLFAIEFVQETLKPGYTVDKVFGFGVREGFGEWDVFLTEEEALDWFEYLADGRVYSSEAA